MNKKSLHKGLLLSKLIVFLCVGCSTVGQSELTVRQSSKNAYFICVFDVVGTELHKGTHIKKAIDVSEDTCVDEFDVYVDELLERTKKQRGWTSLHKDVRPEAEEGLKKETRKFLMESFK